MTKKLTSSFTKVLKYLKLELNVELFTDFKAGKGIKDSNSNWNGQAVITCTIRQNLPYYRLNIDIKWTEAWIPVTDYFNELNSAVTVSLEFAVVPRLSRFRNTWVWITKCREICASWLLSTKPEFKLTRLMPLCNYAITSTERAVLQVSQESD